MFTDSEEIKELVKERYGTRAKSVISLSPVPVAATEESGDSGSDCESDGDCCGPVDLDHAIRMYNEGELAGLPAETVAVSAGCGNPTALAGLRQGERVLDLGSGGGIDCFLAARQVGETGFVTGLDMTPDMLALARKNLADVGLTNVEFVQGEMESMPLPDGSYDVIISNCVVNLSPDKDAVFNESFRVLAPGGRVHLSDVLALSAEGPSVTGPESWVDCTAGAEHKDLYLDRLHRVGFVDIQIDSEDFQFRKDDELRSHTNTASFRVVAHKPI